MSTHYDSSQFYEPSVDFDYDSIDFNYHSIDEDSILEELPPIIQMYVKQKIKAEVQDALSRVLSLVYDSSDYRLKVATIVMAFGLPMFMGKSQKTVAELHGVSKQALSKSIKRLQKMFRLPPTRGQKSEKACEKYRQIQLNKHSENQ